MLQRERVKLAASFWNNMGADMVIGGMAAAFFLDKPQGASTKIGIANDARPRRIRREVYVAYTRQRVDAGAVVAWERKKCTEKPKFKVNEQCGAI
jgi:hypothetical protein